jgi:NADH dehydrogenase/putative oxidoreductase
LAVGLLVRPAALLLLVLSLTMPAPGQVQEIFLLHAVLFAWYVVEGAGPLSLDRILSKGLAASPLPLATRAVQAGHWIETAIGPAWRLLVRMWLAVSLVAAALGVALPAAFLTADAAMVPSSLAFVAGVLLALGAATPFVALALVSAATGMAMMGPPHAMTLYPPLLFALLGTCGAGRFSLDGLLVHLLHRPVRNDGTEPHVVIVGAGFGGIACAAGLRHERVRVTLIDRRNYHLFQPLLYQVATASLSPGDIATPIRSVFRDDPRIRVLNGAVTAVDSARHLVHVDDQALSYDFLVLATGAQHSYFGNDAWAPYAPGLKFVEDAVAVRGRILAAFERAEATDDAAERAALLTFVVCGGGPTGVELAGAIAELARRGLDQEFRSFDPASARIILVQAGPRILPQFPDRLSAFAQRSLEALGVEVWTGVRVELIDRDGAVVAGKRVAAATVLWAAGVAASPASTWLGAAADPAGRLIVAPDLSVPGHDRVFAVGDTALSRAWGGQPVPGVAPAAKQGGAYVAAVIAAGLQGRDPPPPFRYRHQGSLATIGRKSAVVDFGWLKLTGAPAWWLWGMVHVLFLVGVRNRIAVIVGWGWSYFTYRLGVRLITGDPVFAVGRNSFNMRARETAE